jgi:CDP-6-deoxy-D-xylo-4-hexulose-3-dehydrase
MFAHVLGNPPDMDRVMSLVEKYNLIFLEDSCDALGSLYDGKKLGSFGHMSTCSFYPAHHMTMGEGGFVATDDPRLRRVLASFRDWGRACYCNEKKPGDVTSGTACGDRFRPWLKCGEEKISYDHRYVFDEIGFNLKPLEMQAAIGLEQLNKLPDMDSARRYNFKSLDKIFSKYEEYFMLPKKTEKSDPCWFGYLLTVKENDKFSKEQLVRHLEDHKIQTRSYFTGNCLYHPAYSEYAAKYDDLMAEFPNAHKATIDTFFLGTFIGITDEKLKYIEETVDEFFKRL